MVKRVNDQMWFRIASTDRRKVERAAKMEGMKPSEFVRNAAVNLAVETIDAADSNRREAEA